jgi:hypothetical protein
MRAPTRITLLTLALAGCQGATSGPAVPVPASGSSAVAAANAFPGPPPILDLKWTAAVATAAGGEVPLSPGAETTVEPRATFRVELPLPLADARLSLLDGGDALVASSATREVGQATLLTLVPASALPAGSRLRLRVDGATTRELHAVDGRRFAPVEWLVLVAGEPPDKRPPGRKGKRR